MTPREDLLARAVTWFAEHGVGDRSLRSIATGIGTSHRMLNYHFGSRAGLLAAVVEAVERGERAELERLLGTHDDPWVAGELFWTHVADTATTFAPLFFELSAAAIRGEPWATGLRRWLGTGWSDGIAALHGRIGHPPEVAEELARLSVASARGILLELCATGDRAAADAAMARFTSLVRAASP